MLQGLERGMESLLPPFGKNHPLWRHEYEERDPEFFFDFSDAGISSDVLCQDAGTSSSHDVSRHARFDCFISPPFAQRIVGHYSERRDPSVTSGCLSQVADDLALGARDRNSGESETYSTAVIAGTGRIQRTSGRHDYEGALGREISCLESLL